MESERSNSIAVLDGKRDPRMMLRKAKVQGQNNSQCSTLASQRPQKGQSGKKLSVPESSPSETRKSWDCLSERTAAKWLVTSKFNERDREFRTSSEL